MIIVFEVKKYLPNNLTEKRYNNDGFENNKMNRKKYFIYDSGIRRIIIE